MQSKCTECGFKKSRFVQEQEARHLLSTLGIKTLFSKIPLLNILTELHLKQLRFTHSACDSFTENKERIKKFIQSGNANFIYRNELHKACFHKIWLMVNLKIQQKELNQTKFREIKHLKLPTIQNMMNTKDDQLRWFTSFFNEKSSGNGVGVKTNYQLANEPHREIIKTFKRRRVYSPLRDGLCGLDVADMQSLNKYNKRIKYLLCAIDLFSKYAQVVPLKDE